MARIEADRVMGRPVDPGQGEGVRAIFRADRRAYWRGHLIMALGLGLAAGLGLSALGNPYPIAGPVGAVLAIAARAGFLAREALGEVWRLTDRRLLGPNGQSLPLGQITTAQAVLGAVQVVMQSGHKHLIRYQRDAAAVAATIRAAKAGTE